MDRKTLTDFVKACKDQHDVVCNQKYADEYPYSFHLAMVLAKCHDFQHLVLDTERPIVQMGCAAHDLIEDARMSYNDVMVLVGSTGNFHAQEVAEIVFLCTEMRGRTRAERKPEQFYTELRENRLAVFVKLCDIIANSMFSAATGSRMLKRYKEEYPKINALLFMPEYEPMFKYLETIYKLAEV
jgi:hypothetical protein